MADPYYSENLSPRHIVMQSRAIHPDWSPQDHLDYLMAEESWRWPNLEAQFGIMALPGERTPLDTITRWLQP